jgi:HK97 family phage portal protein
LSTSVPQVTPPAVSEYSLRVFGREIFGRSRRPLNGEVLPPITKSPVGVTDLSEFSSGRGGWLSIISNVIREPFTGAWQRNSELRTESVTAHSAVYSNVTLIASDISKMCLRLVEEDSNGIWKEVNVAAFSPVLRKPNRYQNRIKFIEQWVVSKLLHGNTYVLKQRDNRNIVVAMYVLDPLRVKPLVTPDGSVYYQCSKDNLAGIDDNSIVVPASEIIHDTMVPLYHPLCGVSPIYACGVAALQGLAIQRNSTRFFQNGATPGGVLTAPGTIDEPTAKRLKEHWEENYSGANSGRVAVLGDGLKYERMVMTSVEAQMIEQLKWSAETVCSCFHVPPYMIGVGAYPVGSNIEATNQQYYSQALQAPIEAIELLLDEGLGLDEVSGHTYGTEFDLDGLLRMDTATQIEALAKAVGGSIMTPNAALKKMNQPPVTGGNTIYMQQQNYSLEALSKRDAQADPFAAAAGKTAPMPAAAPAAAAAADDSASLDDAAKAQIIAWELKKAFDSEPLAA